MEETRCLESISRVNQLCFEFAEVWFDSARHEVIVRARGKRHPRQPKTDTASQEGMNDMQQTCFKTVDMIVEMHAIGGFTRPIRERMTLSG